MKSWSFSYEHDLRLIRALARNSFDSCFGKGTVMTVIYTGFYFFYLAQFYLQPIAFAEWNRIPKIKGGIILPFMIAQACVSRLTDKID